MSVFPGVQACTKAAPRRELVQGPGTFFAKSLAGGVGLLLLVCSMRVTVAGGDRSLPRHNDVKHNDSGR